MSELAYKISPKNLIMDFGYFESWSAGVSLAPDGWTMTGTAGSVARESTEIQYGVYSLKITSGGSSVYAAERSLSEHDSYAGKTLKLFARVKCSSASKARIYIDDGVGRQNSSYHSGGGGWETLEVTIQVDPLNTELTVGMEVASSGVVAYFDGATLVEGETVFTELRSGHTYVREGDLSPRISVDVGVFEAPRRTGALVESVRVGPKRLRINVQTYDTDLDTARSNYQSIVKACMDGEKDLFISDDRYLRVRMSNIPEMRFQANHRVYNVSVDFIASDPFENYVGTIRQKVSVTGTTHSFSVSYLGSVRGSPAFTFLPPSGITMSSCTLENLTTGERFTFSSDVGPGGTLFLGFDVLEITKNDVPSKENFTGDPMTLVPGTNYFRFLGTKGITILVDKVDKWL